MRFPEWVDSPEDERKRASNRLRYIMLSLATEMTGRGSLRAFAKLVGIDHSTLAYSIRRGSCTAAVAIKIEEALGRERIQNEYLRKPMEIPTA